MKTRSGFTLIELSIVLVIIGLIIGGILLGRDLIHAAEVRKTITQIEQTKTAIATFRGKYNCLPGDCANASEFFTNAVNGDGDGKICCNPTDPEGYPLEIYNVWSQLSAAGLIAGSFPLFNDAAMDSDPDIYNGENLPATDPQILSPSAALAGNFLTVSYDAANDPDDFPNMLPGNFIALSQFPYPDYLLVADGGNIFDVITTIESVFDGNHNSAGIYPQDAFAIDAKMDDGLPLSGSVSVLNIAGGALGCTTHDGNNTYIMTAAGNLMDCVVLIRLGL